MPKFCGYIGLSLGCSEDTTKPGVYIEKFQEIKVSGDILKQTWDNRVSNQVNDTITVSHRISIIVDPNISQSIGLIKYVKFLGATWKVVSFEVEYPRLILSLGGVYNGS